MSTFNRVRLRRIVYDELYHVRAYRQAVRKGEWEYETDRVHAEAWVRVADELLACLRDEPGGAAKIRFVEDLFGLTRRPAGSARYVYMRTSEREHVSFATVRTWRDSVLFTASILAVQYGAVYLSDVQAKWQNIEFEHGQI